MKIINAKKCLNRNKLEEFIAAMNGVDEHLEFVFKSDETIKFSGNQSTLYTIFKNSLVHDAIEAFGAETEIEIVAASATMLILGEDVLWWTKTQRKFNQLFALTQEQREADRNQSAKLGLHKETIQRRASIDNSTYKLAVGIRKDNSIVDIEAFEGNQKQMKDFVNKMFQRNHLRSFGRCMTVFCVNYKFDDDLNDINNWKTMQELVDEGVFTK